MHLNNLNKHFKKLQKYDIDYLFNEYNEEDLKMLERFLMNAKVLFHTKEQKKIKKNSLKRKLSTNF